MEIDNKLANKRKWVDWSQKKTKTSKSTIVNEIMEKTVTIRVSHDLKDREKREPKQKLILHRHSLFKYYPLNGFLISWMEKKTKL